MTSPKLSPKQRDMIRRLGKGPQLAGHWDFSGSRVPGQLRKLGLIKRCDHPTVIDRRTGFPAEAYCLTEEGDAAFKDLNR